ncbi:MAG: MASE1 domain-containing protein [Pseudomonadales bacterium]|nr:MASE1 domain-containing protein [Pseudomonadales bacterium]
MASIQKELISSQIPYVFPSNSPIWKTSIWVVSIGVCYFLMVNISVFLFDIPNVNITAFWPLNGIYAASLLMSPRPLWKYIIAVIFLANGLGNFSLGHDWLLSSGFAVANVVEGGLIAYLYLQWNKSNNALGSFKSFFIFLGAVTFSTGIGSVLGAINLSNAFGWNLFWGFFKSWFAADTLGNCLMLAVILSWNDKHLSLVNLKPIQILGSIALAISTIGLSIVVFSQSSENGIIPLNYLVFPLLIWAALQFEVKGASLTAFIIAFIAHWFTIHGKGPFTIYGASTQDYIFWLQDYLVIMFMTAITLAIAVVERKKVEKT